jgi:hypothetical protein
MAYYTASHSDMVRALMGHADPRDVMRPVAVDPITMSIMLGMDRGRWASLQKSNDADYVLETLGTALGSKGSTELLVKKVGAEACQAATVRCFPVSMPGERLQLHLFAARMLLLPALRYLVDQAGFPVDARTAGPLGFSLLHCAACAKAGGGARGKAAVERQLSIVRYLVEERGLSPLLQDRRGKRPSEYVAANDSPVRRYLLEAEQALEAAPRSGILIGGVVAAGICAALSAAYMR